MNRYFSIKGVNFRIINYHARNNPYEKGLKYNLQVSHPILQYVDTGYKFETIKKAKDFANNNITAWL